MYCIRTESRHSEHFLYVSILIILLSKMPFNEGRYKYQVDMIKYHQNFNYFQNSNFITSITCLFHMFQLKYFQWLFFINRSLDLLDTVSNFTKLHVGIKKNLKFFKLNSKINQCCQHFKN